MADEREQSGWRERLNFFNTVFGVAGGIALLVSIFLWLSGNRMLLLFSGFAAFLFLFLWILDFVLKSHTSPIESIGGHLPDTPTPLREHHATDLAPALAPPVPAPQVTAEQIISALREQGFEVKKLEPNLVHGVSKPVNAHEGEHGIIGEGLREGAKNFVAIILPYHNSPHPKRAIGELSNVSAQLYFKFFDGSSPLVVHRGAWLSKKSNRVEFKKNDKLNLILVVVDEADEVYAVGRDFDDVHPEGVTRREPLTQDLASVRINLITESDGMSVDVFEVMLEVVRGADFKVKATELLLWKWAHLMDFQMEGSKLRLKIYELEAQGQFKDETKEQVVGEVREWVTRAADFVGRHLGEHQKKAFVDAYPSIEQGSQEARRMPSLLQPLGQQQEQYTPSHWTIHDSIGVRCKKLEEYAKGLYPLMARPRK